MKKEMNKLQIKRFGKNLLIVNPDTLQYYLEKNKFISEYIENYFQGKRNYSIKELDKYIDFLTSYLSTQRNEKHTEISSIYFELTNQCNLHCNHCYNNSNDPTRNRQELAYTIVHKVILDNRKFANLKIILSGGEPTLHPEFSKIIEMLLSYEIPVFVYTNGQNINNFSHLLNYKGVKIIVSLDGANRVQHDLVRGEGSFQRTLYALDKAKKDGFLSQNLWISFTINKYNYMSISHMIELSKSLGAKKVFINPVIPAGRNCRAVFDLNAQQLVTVYKSLLNLSQNRQLEVDSSIFWKIRYIQKNLQIPRECSICKKLRVASNGDVFPCTFFNDKNLLNQNIYHNSTLFQSDNYNDILLRESKRGILNCNLCIYRVFCNSGCAAKGYHNGIWGISEVQCEANKIFFESELENI